MSVWRVAACMGVLLAAVCSLSACSSSASQLDKLTQAEPDSTRQRAMRRLSLATAYYEQNQSDVAQQEVRAALQIDPNYAEAYSLLGLIHQRDKATVLAQQSFEQAMALASKSPVRTAELAAIQHNYGWFLCEQNRFAEAQVQFDFALAQSSYRQADKTHQAIALCKARQRNN
jgi:type IV pilus assembly protein PilF